MKLRRFLFPALALFVTLFAAFYFLRAHPGNERAGMLSKTAWQRMASPGALSKAHTFLEHNCAACHTSGKGVEAASCIVCHANNTRALAAPADGLPRRREQLPRVPRRTSRSSRKADSDGSYGVVARRSPATQKQS